MSTSRTGQTSALLDRISRLQSRLNERVSLANSIQVEKHKSESIQPTTEASRCHELPAVARKLDPNAQKEDQQFARAYELATLKSDSHIASLEEPNVQAATVEDHLANIPYLDVQGERSKAMNGPAQNVTSLRAKISELEDTLRASEAQSRNLRHQLTQTQEEFAKQSKELTAVCMSLDASKKSQEAMNSKLRMLEAEKDLLEHVNHGSPRKVSGAAQDDAGLAVQVRKMKLEIEGRDRQIKLLESRLNQDAATATTSSDVPDRSGNEELIVNSATAGPTVVDPELEQYNVVQHDARASPTSNPDRDDEGALAPPSRHEDEHRRESSKSMDQRIGALEVYCDIVAENGKRRFFAP